MKGDSFPLKMLLITILCCLALTAVRADEDNRRFLYQWADDQGGVHITDNLQNVPTKYRSRVKQIGQPDAGESSPGGQAQQGWPAAGLDAGQEAANEEQRKAEWQQRMIDARRRLQYAEEKYGQLELRKSNLQAQWGSAGAALPTQEVMEEMKQLDADLAIARSEVDSARDLVNNVIPDQARRAGVPPGWLREVE